MNREAPETVAIGQWRPQAFGRESARSIDDPVIEPLWSGMRVLAIVTGKAVDVVDAEGESQDRPAIAAAIGGALQADAAVLDGYLTTDAAQSGVGVFATVDLAGPTPGELARQYLIGGRNRRGELVDKLEARAEVHETREVPDEGVVFVAVDLLMIDGEPLLDVPLLERKRLLDGAIVPGELVRLGIHIRPPVDPWLGTWRNVGFRQLAYKDPNGRYRPGERNDGWATADIPRR
jgi:ATP-dependent DNA ligase